jgi:hypothetical protein
VPRWEDEFLSDSFDPYLKWFGIPLRDRPVHHYRLLAIELFEADAEVIENAADQRMAHLKRFNTGKHSALAEGLLNEVAAARVCLLNPAKKASYDEELRQRLAAQPPLAQVAAETSAAAPPPIASPGEDFLTQFETAPSRPQRPTRPTTKKKKTKTPWAVIAAVVTGLAAVILIVVLTAPQKGGNGAPAGQVASATGTDGQDRPPVSTQKGKPKSERADHGAEKTPAPPAVPENHQPPGPAQTPAAPPGAEPAATPAASGHGNEPSAGSLMPAEKPGEKPAANGNPPELNRPKSEDSSRADLARESIAPGPPDVEAKQPANLNLLPPTGPKKIPAPDEAAIKAAHQKLHDRYQWEMANSNSDAEKLQFAARLVRDADNVHDDSTTRLVMLQEAVKLAREAGDTGKANEILDTIGQSYDINVLAIKVDMVQGRADELGKALAAPGSITRGPRLQQLQKSVRELLDACQALTFAALERGDIDTALRCLNIARPAANRLNDHKTKLAIESSIKDMEKLRGRLAKVQAAIAALRDKPDDPETNLTAGTWYCLVAGDWDTGLPYLAKASSADLADAAAKDLAQPSIPADQVAAGNLWWNLAEKRTGLEAMRLKNRAAHWYLLALPKLSGMIETRVRKRLDTLGGSGQYALEFDGRGSYVLFPKLVYTGATPITIEAVVKVDHDNRWGNRFLIGNGDHCGLGIMRQGESWVFRIQTILNARGTDIPITAWGGPNSSGDAGSTSWTHVAGVYDGREIRIYVDGHRRRGQQIFGQVKPGDSPFVLGAWPGGGDRSETGDAFKGQVRAVRISKLALYNDEFVPAPLTNGPATMALFTFTEGRGDRIKDAANKKIFGEIHGAQWVKLSDAGAHP